MTSVTKQIVATEKVARKYNRDTTNTTTNYYNNKKKKSIYNKPLSTKYMLMTRHYYYPGQWFSMHSQFPKECTT